MSKVNNYCNIYLKKEYLKYLNTSKKKQRKSSYDMTIHHENNNNEKSGYSFKQKLKKVFDLYVQTGESVYTDKLKRDKFIKMCVDMGIINECDINIKQLELMVIKTLQNKVKLIDFEKFLELFYVLSSYIYESKKEVNSEFNNIHHNEMNDIENENFKMFLINYPIKLYNQLFTEQNDNNSSFQESIDFDTNNNVDIDNEQISQSERKYHHNNTMNISSRNNSNTKINTFYNPKQTFSNKKKHIHNITNSIAKVDNINLHKNYEELLMNISLPMFELYKRYFPLEFVANIPNNYSIKQFQKFLTDFNIFPFLLTKSELYQIYQNEIDSTTNEQFHNIILHSLINNPIYNNVYQTNINIGKVFTFIKFVKSIFEIADFGLDKISFNMLYNNTNKSSSYMQNKDKKYTTFEKICFILERIELSEKFQSIDFKPYKVNYIIPNKILESIKREIIEREDEDYQLTLRDNEITQTKFIYYEYIIDKYSKELNYVFDIYSETNKVLKQTKFVKLLTDCGLIKSLHSHKTNIQNAISTITADLIYTHITNLPYDINNNSTLISKNNTITLNTINHNNINHKLSTLNSTINNNNNNFNNIQSTIQSNTIQTNPLLSSIPYFPKPKSTPFTFTSFIYSIEIISNHIYHQITQDSIDSLCQIIINNLYNDIYNEETLLDLIYKEKEANKNFENVYITFFQTIFPLFKIYMNNKGYITLQKWFSFLSDFDLFPMFISKTKLYAIFKLTCNYGKDFVKENENDNNNNTGLNHQMFCDALIQIAFEIPYGKKEPNDIEKIICLAERIANSDGINKIINSLISSTALYHGKNFDIMTLFKLNYPDYFTNDIIDKDNKKKQYNDVLNEVE